MRERSEKGNLEGGDRRRGERGDKDRKDHVTSDSNQFSQTIHSTTYGKKKKKKKKK